MWMRGRMPVYVSENPGLSLALGLEASGGGAARLTWRVCFSRRASCSMAPCRLFCGD